MLIEQRRSQLDPTTVGVIERNLAHALEADVNLEFSPEGVRCRMRIPSSNLAGGR